MRVNDELVAGLRKAEIAADDLEQQVNRQGGKMTPHFEKEAEKVFMRLFELQHIIRRVSCNVSISKDGLIEHKGDRSEIIGRRN